MNRHIRVGSLVPVFFLCTVFLLNGCGGSGSADETGGEQGQSSAVGGGEAYRVDLDAILPPHPARDILLNNCQNCHTWVPIVILQMNEIEWARNRGEHRSRVESLSDEDFDRLYEYLVSTFTPDRPVPELPAPLLESWTTY